MFTLTIAQLTTTYDFAATVFNVPVVPVAVVPVMGVPVAVVPVAVAPVVAPTINTEADMIAKLEAHINEVTPAVAPITILNTTDEVIEELQVHMDECDDIPVKPVKKVITTPASMTRPIVSAELKAMYKYDDAIELITEFGAEACAAKLVKTVAGQRWTCMYFRLPNTVQMHIISIKVNQNGTKQVLTNGVFKIGAARKRLVEQKAAGYVNTLAV